MKKNFSAIVVGGGLAGLTAAAYLSRAGLTTLLVEKRNKTGGLVDTFWHQGFAFDAGIRAIENSGIVYPMLRDLGITMDVIKNSVSIGYVDQSVNLNSKECLAEYLSMLKRLFQANSSEITHIKHEIQKVMGYMKVLYGIDNPLFHETMDLRYLTRTLLPWLVKYEINIQKAMRLNEPVQTYLSRFTNNHSLIDMITQHFFTATPTFFALSYFSLYLDYTYPLGGTGVLAEKMTDYIQSTGGEILTNQAVVDLDTKRKEIVLETGQVHGYDKLIWAANQKTLYHLVEGLDDPSVQQQQAIVEQAIGGDSILTLFLGVDKSPEYFGARCGSHMFYTPSLDGLSSVPDWKENFNQQPSELFQWINNYLARTTYEISCPALRDDKLAPEGKTGVIISTLFDYNLVQQLSDSGNYETFKDFCIEKIVQILEQSLLPKLQESILFAICATPLTIERETLNAEGAITGWSFTNRVIPSEHRFKKMTQAVITPISDVFQCGQWTFSPSGLPVSILTGKLAADQVIKSCK